MHRSNRGVLGLLVIAALVLSACGSTLPTDQQRALASGQGLRVSADGRLVPTDGTATVAADGSLVLDDGTVIPPGAAAAVRGGATSVGAGAAAGGDGLGSAGGGATTARGASAPGVTATEIKLGLVYDKSAGALNAAFGFGGIGQIDQKRAYDALIADVNKRGGILGRKLVPVYHAIDTAGPDATTPREVTEQRICTTFTENRVFATFVTGGETFTRCMNKLGVVRVGTGAVDSQLLAESPLLVVLNVTLDRSARFTTVRLGQRGFYREGRNGEKNVKIGLIRYDAPEFARAAAALKEELAKQGLQLTKEIAIKQAETADQIQDETNSLRAAALQFKSDGITNVQFLSDGRAYMELIFMQSAEKQLYRPRYGLNSTSGGQALATLLGNDAQSQLAQSLQVGWFPIFDVERASYSGDKTTTAFRRCIQLLEQAGERFTEGDPTRNKEAIAAAYCDLFNYFSTAAIAAGADLSPDTFIQRGAATVDGLDSAATYILATTKRRDAYGGIRDARWIDACTCFRFESQTIYPV